MHNSTLTPAGKQAQPWRHAALNFIALSAAISVELLEEKDEHGRHRFARGRHKYYGIGCLVIFFAVFSGYGMGHMLATMSTISAWGAALAGVVWACFQWCLERQILISIRTDAAWWQKCFGLSWRAVLALLSASTMVYPFFVESNRAEIDVKVGEMARSRLIDNNTTAQLAVGLPALLERGHEVNFALKQVDLLLVSDPPQRLSHDENLTNIKTKLRAELRLPVLVFRESLQQLGELERLSGASTLIQNSPQRLHMLEQAVAQIVETFSAGLLRKPSSASG